MGKPTETERQQAMATAIKMRETGNDPDFVAKSLLNLNYRVQKLERVMTATRRYLHAGQSTSDHLHLIQALQAAEETRAGPEDRDTPFPRHDH